LYNRVLFNENDPLAETNARDFIELVKKRRSTRYFFDKKVSEKLSKRQERRNCKIF
jgi:hypothetical protein